MNFFGVFIPTEMKSKELSVAASDSYDDLAPAPGNRIRVLGICACHVILINLSSTVRSTLAFGTGHVADPSKILSSFRAEQRNNSVAHYLSGINKLGDIDEVVRLTQMTYTVGSAESNVVVYYIEETLA